MPNFLKKCSWLYKEQQTWATPWQKAAYIFKKVWRVLLFSANPSTNRRSNDHSKFKSHTLHIFSVKSLYTVTQKIKINLFCSPLHPNLLFSNKNCLCTNNSSMRAPASSSNYIAPTSSSSKFFCTYRVGRVCSRRCTRYRSRPSAPPPLCPPQRTSRRNNSKKVKQWKRWLFTK